MISRIGPYTVCRSPIGGKIFDIDFNSITSIQISDGTTQCTIDDPKIVRNICAFIDGLRCRFAIPNLNPDNRENSSWFILNSQNPDDRYQNQFYFDDTTITVGGFTTWVDPTVLRYLQGKLYRYTN